MNMRIKQFTIIASLCLIACSKKPELAQKTSFEILDYLPKNSLAFFATDYTSPRFQESLKGRWANILEIVPSNEPTTLALTNVMTELTKPSANKGQAVANLYYVAASDPLKPSICSLWLAKEGGDLTWARSKVIDALKSNNIKFSESGNTVTIETGEAGPFFHKNVVVRFESGFIKAGSGPECIDGDLVKEPVKPAVTSSPEFEAFLTKTQDSFAFQVTGIDFASANPLIQQALQKQDPNLVVNEVQVKHALVSSNFDRGLRVNALIIPVTSYKTTALTAESLPMTKLIPEGSAASFEISGAPLSSSPELTGGVMLPPSISAIKRIGLYIQSGEIGSLAPEISILIQSDAEKETFNEISSTVKGLLGLAGGSMSPWSSKKIGNIEVHSSISPIGGLGIFMGQIDGATLISSTDEPFRFYQDPNRANASLEKKLRDYSIEPQANLASGHLDFAKLTKIYQEVKGTIALLAPQQESAETQKLEKLLESLGLVLFELKFEGQNISLNLQIPE